MRPRNFQPQRSFRWRGSTSKHLTLAATKWLGGSGKTTLPRPVPHLISVPALTQSKRGGHLHSSMPGGHIHSFSHACMLRCQWPLACFVCSLPKAPAAAQYLAHDSRVSLLEPGGLGVRRAGVDPLGCDLHVPPASCLAGCTAFPSSP
jgi:hypothetical protein